MKGSQRNGLVSANVPMRGSGDKFGDCMGQG